VWVKNIRNIRCFKPPLSSRHQIKCFSTFACLFVKLFIFCILCVLVCFTMVYLSFFLFYRPIYVFESMYFIIDVCLHSVYPFRYIVIFCSICLCTLFLSVLSFLRLTHAHQKLTHSHNHSLTHSLTHTLTHTLTHSCSLFVKSVTTENRLLL